MSIPSSETLVVSYPPGPALVVGDAGAREAWATLEQLLLVADDFLNDLATVDAMTISSSAHGCPARHTESTDSKGAMAQAAAPGRGAVPE